jgi:hypothetical protein
MPIGKNCATDGYSVIHSGASKSTLSMYNFLKKNMSKEEKSRAVFSGI